jgi:copper chaperone
VGPPSSPSPDRRIARDTVAIALAHQENTMTEFLVEGMSCGHCVNVVTEAVHMLDPAAEVFVDLGSKHVRIHSDVDRFLLSQALLDAGYAPLLVGLAASDQRL